MNYRVLALDPYSKHMSLPVLRAIYKLVEHGAVVAGRSRPTIPSLADDAGRVQEAERRTVWRRHRRALRRQGQSLRRTESRSRRLKTLNVAPDFDYTKPESDTRILFVHRKLADGDLYFLDNRNDRDETVDASFRVTGKAPEFWHAETGKSEPASYKIAGRPHHCSAAPGAVGHGVRRVPQGAKATSRTLPKPVETQLATVDGPWNVTFQPGRGAPASITLDKLTSWSDSQDTGVKYFSGTGTYTKDRPGVRGLVQAGRALWIDLGDVKNLAEVTVNGKSLGIVWHAPYRVDATGALKPGANEVTIKVTNAWVNRLIGDEQPDATTKYTFADVKPYKANSPLLPSGLLGPVKVEQATTQ